MSYALFPDFFGTQTEHADYYLDAHRRPTTRSGVYLAVALNFLVEIF